MDSNHGGPGCLEDSSAAMSAASWARSVLRSASLWGTMTVMKRRGKAIAVSTAPVGFMVLLAVGFAARNWIAEEWYLYRLETGNVEQRLSAIQELETRRSQRAIPKLVCMLYKEEEQPVGNKSAA